MDQGLGQAPNGNGGGKAEFDKYPPRLEKIERKPFDPDKFFTSMGSKKDKPKQCKLEENPDSKENTESKKSKVKVDFDYILDQNGNPVLLIPDNNPLLEGKEKVVKVDYQPC